MLEAYTVRKAIPRILIAVIGINLSIYLCVAMIDITNIIGSGLGQLITTPFDTAELNVFTVETSKTSWIVGGVGLAIAAKPAINAIGSITTSIGTTGGSGIITSALAALFFLLLPIMLLVLAILATVIIRQALLFFLTVVSAVAIAAFVLPGTEKYFKKWWDLFIKTLLVYPIIAVIFAISDVFASIIFSSASGTPGLAQIITGLVVIFSPLFLIPFAFRLAGGAIAQIAKVAGGIGDKASQSGFVKNRRDYYGQRAKDDFTRGRIQAYRKAMDAENTSSGIQRRWAGARKRAYAGYKADVLARESELNKRAAEMTSDETNFGDDALVRAYTVDRRSADQDWANEAGRRISFDEFGRQVTTSANGLRRQNADGSIQYRSAGGSWQTEASVDEAERRYGRKNTSQYQASMAYEMKKAITQEEQDQLVSSYGAKMDSWGATGDEANSVWIGAGFANQDKNRQWKHGRWKTDEKTGKYMMSANAGSLIREVDENIGSYQGSQSNADTWTTMAKQVQDAGASYQDSMQSALRIQAIPEASRTAAQTQELQAHQANMQEQQETLMRASRVVSSIRTTQQERNEDGTPTGRVLEVVGAGAPGRVQEEMRAFAKITDQVAGVYTEQTTPTAPVQQRTPTDVTQGIQSRRDTRTDREKGADRIDT